MFNLNFGPCMAHSDRKGGVSSSPGFQLEAGVKAQGISASISEAGWPAETFDVAWRKSALFDRLLSFDVYVRDNREAGN